MNILITDIDTGRTIYHGYVAELRDVWPTIEPIVAEWFSASPDDIQCGEHDLHGDVIEIAGKAVATIEHVYRRPELAAGDLRGGRRMSTHYTPKWKDRRGNVLIFPARNTLFDDFDAARDWQFDQMIWMVPFGLSAAGVLEIEATNGQAEIPNIPATLGPLGSCCVIEGPDGPAGREVEPDDGMLDEPLDPMRGVDFPFAENH